MVMLFVYVSQKLLQIVSLVNFLKPIILNLKLTVLMNTCKLL